MVADMSTTRDEGYEGSLEVSGARSVPFEGIEHHGNGDNASGGILPASSAGQGPSTAPMSSLPAGTEEGSEEQAASGPLGSSAGHLGNGSNSPERRPAGESPEVAPRVHRVEREASAGEASLGSAIAVETVKANPVERKAEADDTDSASALPSAQEGGAAGPGFQPASAARLLQGTRTRAVSSSDAPDQPKRQRRSAGEQAAVTSAALGGQGQGQWAAAAAAVPEPGPGPHPWGGTWQPEQPPPQRERRRLQPEPVNEAEPHLSPEGPAAEPLDDDIDNPAVSEGSSSSSANSDKSARGTPDGSLDARAGRSVNRDSAWGSTLVCADLTVTEVASQYFAFLKGAVGKPVSVG
jgi:hypothetical protein